MNEELLIEFIKEAKKLIASYFKKNINNTNLSIGDVYPIDAVNVANGKDLPINIQQKLSELYEKMIPCNLRKDYGIFYTNANKVIDSMVKECDVLAGKILEPACGTGFFLVNIIQNITVQMTTKGCSSEEILDYITENIYGNDVDEFVLKIAEINLLATLLPLLVDAVNKNEKYIKVKHNSLHCYGDLLFIYTLIHSISPSTINKHIKVTIFNIKKCIIQRWIYCCSCSKKMNFHNTNMLKLSLRIDFQSLNARKKRVLSLPFLRFFNLIKNNCHILNYHY